MPGPDSSPWDCLFTSAGLPLFLADIALDVVAAVDLYRDGAYGCLAALLLLLLGSSALAQLYSWLWYSYDGFQLHSRVEAALRPGLGPLHWAQLGIYVRHAAVLENTHWPCRRTPPDATAFLNHDLSMLRIIETFSESAPQIVLMLAVILRQGNPDLVLVLKTAGSLSAVAFCVTAYHRCLRSFLPDARRQPLGSSVVYFLWNLLLLSARIVALALFASVEPCFVFSHFLCSWLPLTLCAWRAQTAFMEDAAGEALYRATVGLIWYFNWFNAVDGDTRRHTALYHAYVLLDVCFLCGWWYWRTASAPPHHHTSCREAAAVWGGVVLGYAAGLLVKLVYYRFFHPTLYAEELEPRRHAQEDAVADEVDAAVRAASPAPDASGPAQFRLMSFGSGQPEPEPEPVPVPVLVCNKRMKKLAQNFYHRPAEGGAV